MRRILDGLSSFLLIVVCSWGLNQEAEEASWQVLVAIDVLLFAGVAMGLAWSYFESRGLKHSPLLCLDRLTISPFAIAVAVAASLLWVHYVDSAYMSHHPWIFRYTTYIGFCFLIYLLAQELLEVRARMASDRVNRSLIASLCRSASCVFLMASGAALVLETLEIAGVVILSEEISRSTSRLVNTAFGWAEAFILPDFPTS